jgi:hypothetical protein
MIPANRPVFLSRPALAAVALAIAFALLASSAGQFQAYALSELKPGQTPPIQPPAEAEPDNASPQTPAPGGIEIPSPDPITPPVQSDDETAPDDQQPAEANPPVDEGKLSIARPDVDADGPIPEIQYDLTKLPEPVQRMRQLLVDAAVSGDIEKLRPLIGTGARAPLLSLTEATDADPVAYLRSQAGDDEGREILAILEEVLNAGYVRLNTGTPQEIYAWPYFFGIPIDNLTPRQTVELFKIITGGEYEEMRQVGAYVFFRVGILPT